MDLNDQTPSNTPIRTPIRSLHFDIGNFERVPHAPDEFVVSPGLQCDGFCWTIQVYPGGRPESDVEVETDGNVGESVVWVYFGLSGSPVENCGDPLLKVKFAIFLGEHQVGDNCISHIYKGGLWGSHSPVRRSEVLRPNGKYLKNGVLKVKIYVQILGMEMKPVWYPEVGPRDDDLIKLMESTTNTDVHFKVGDDNEFPAYRCILEVKAPTLHELIQNVEPGGTVEVDNVTASTFKALLRFVYGRELPDSNLLQSNGRELLCAANRFGCKQLKLYVESKIAHRLVTKKNAADWIVFADSHACALLKETAMDLFARNPREIMESDGWATLSESRKLVLELMKHRFLRPWAKCLGIRI